MRFLASVLVSLVALVGLSIPGQAAPQAVDTAPCVFDVGNGGHAVTMAVPSNVFGVACADLRSQVRVGPVSQQDGPYGQWSEWTWKWCVYVHTSNGTHEWCLTITIKISTTIPGTGTLDLNVLRANTNASPVRVCWEEKLPGGVIATHCVEITIEIG
jgi:hypothetical protein